MVGKQALWKIHKGILLSEKKKGILLRTHENTRKTGSQG